MIVELLVNCFLTLRIVYKLNLNVFIFIQLNYHFILWVLTRKYSINYNSNLPINSYLMRYINTSSEAASIITIALDMLKATPKLFYSSYREQVISVEINRLKASLVQIPEKLKALDEILQLPASLIKCERKFNIRQIFQDQN